MRPRMALNLRSSHLGPLGPLKARARSQGHHAAISRCVSLFIVPVGFECHLLHIFNDRFPDGET